MGLDLCVEPARRAGSTHVQCPNAKIVRLYSNLRAKDKNRGVGYAISYSAMLHSSTHAIGFK
jgi:hypothetical protein